MRYFGSLLLLLSLGVSQAQVTITSASMPDANDTFRYAVTQPLAFQDMLQQTGPNQQWVFNSGQSLVTRLDEFEPSSKTPYAFYFWNTTGKKVLDTIGMGQYQLEDVYRFYSSSSSAYQAHGLGFKIGITPFPLAGFYQVKDKVFQFPLEYQDRDSSGFDIKISIPNLGSFRETGYRINDVIGYGKCIVVNDTFDALMVRSTQFGQDSITIQGNSFGIPFERVDYLWLSPDFNAPLACISGNSIMGNFIPTRSEYMNFAAKPNQGGGGGTGIQDLKSDYQLFYPNPASDKLTLHETVDAVYLYGSDGKLIIEERGVSELNITDLPKGVYLIRLLDKTGMARTARVVKN